MADISQINLPNGSSVNIKDATARSDKMDKTNPTGTGELSINRRANSTTGNKSSTLGYNCVASGSYSHAEGQATTASGNYGSHAEGAGTTAAGNYSHAEGQYTAAQGSSSHAEGLSSQTGTNADGAHAEGNTCIANGAASHAEGYATKSPGDYSHSEGRNTEAKGTASHAEGYGTTANHKSQHVFGEYNVLDNSEAATTEKGNYVEVVGNGTGTSARSNARTLDWSGNETLAGGLTASGNVNVKDGNGNTKVSLNGSTGDISCTSVNGVTPTEVAANPSGTGSADLTKIQIGNSIYDIPQGGGGSGGHTIVDDSGTSLTQRTNLQFNGAYSEDNSADDTTEINIVREMTKAEFDLLTEAEKTGLINITDITSGNDDRFQPALFSEEEQEIGVWVDGKPLYQKSFIFTSSLTITDNWVATPFSISNIEKIIDGIIWRFDSSGSVYIDTNKSGDNIRISTKSKNTNFAVGSVLTVRYTKSTDTAGSGTWTPQGVPAQHYSEDEQVIGTWIDGSTLYEKTYHNSSITVASNTELTIDDFSDKFPVSCCGVMRNSTDNRTYYPNWTYTSGNIYYRKNDSGNLVLRSESDSWGNTWEVFTTVRYIKEV